MYQDFGGFSEELANLPYLVNLQEIRINRIKSVKATSKGSKDKLDNNEARLQISILAHTYHYNTMSNP